MKKRSIEKIRAYKEKRVSKHTPEKKKMQTVSTSDSDLNLNRQEHIVEEFAKRWWFALPPVWPPVDHDYS